MTNPPWLDELGPVVEHPAWKRPQPQVMIGRYCRLEPLNLDRHGHDLWEQMGVADPEHRQWMFLAGHVDCSRKSGPPFELGLAP